MVTQRRPLRFTPAVAAQPKTQTDWRLRIDSISHSDAVIAAEWLNSAKGTAAYRRVIAFRGELEFLSKTLVVLRQQRREAKAGRPHGRAAILADANAAAELGKLQEQFRTRHNALNQVLSRYTYIPALAYSPDFSAWRFNTVPKHRTAGQEIELSDGVMTIRVTESSVIAALARLAASRELNKVRLCEQCGKRWIVSLREMDKFCKSDCREASYKKSPEFKNRKAANQRRYRERLKRAQANGAALR